MPDSSKEHHNYTYEASEMSQDRGRESESNPLVALRRFADEQVSSMLQSIIGLPSSVSPPQNDRWATIAHNDDPKNMNSTQPSGIDNATEQNHTSGENTERTSGGLEKPR